MFINQKNYKEDSIKFFVKLDKKGRIVIPAEIRRSLGIRPNDTLIIFFSLKEGIKVVKYNNSSTGSIIDRRSVSLDLTECSPEKGDENE